jgi:hypothetical protein
MFTKVELLDRAVDCPWHNVIAVNPMLRELNFTKQFITALIDIPNYYHPD